jgi:hypothetical protein
MAPVVALKVAVVAFAATVTDAGIVSNALLCDSVTVAPPDGAACDSVTVQFIEEFGPRLAGLQTSEDTPAAPPTRFRVVLAVLPLKVAETVAVWLEEIVRAATVNFAVVAPALTVTDVGRVSGALPAVSVIAVPPVGAAFDNVTVQVLDAFDPMLVGLQVTDETNTGATRLTVAVALLPL